MSNYMTLVGTEDVSRAGSNMRQAASEMQSAAGSISYANEMQQRFMNDWLDRFEAVFRADLDARLAAAKEILAAPKEGE